METSDNGGNWAPVLNHEGIGKGKKKMFLGRDEKITKAATGDGNKVIKVRERVKPF